jgi:hypothetical protein
MFSGIPMVELTKKIEKDIWEWLENYIEVEHKFYDYKFPVCPFARSARLKGIVTVKAYESGNVKKFIQSTVEATIKDPDHNICVMIMPPRARWSLGLRQMIDRLNEEIMSQGYFIQMGAAVNTSSLYPGWFNKGNYFAVFLNQLDPVLEGHKYLLTTDYYTYWSKKHYADVVGRRQKTYDDYLKTHNTKE